MLRTGATLLGFPGTRHLCAPLATLGERVPDLGNFIYRVLRRAEACATGCDTDLGVSLPRVPERPACARAFSGLRRTRPRPTRRPLRSYATRRGPCNGERDPSYLPMSQNREMVYNWSLILTEIMIKL
jgi:hypothetical protein